VAAPAAARARNLTLHAAQQARNKAKLELLVVIPLLAGTLYAYARREALFGVDAPIRAGAAVVLVVLGWALARNVGRYIAPALFRRMDPGTAGTASFLIRLFFMALVALLSLRAAGLDPGTLAVGGALAAVVIGLAAQQTLGNLIAGMVLIAARPFKVGDRVRLQAGALGGPVEGEVMNLGLLYTTIDLPRDHIMVPNNMVLASSVTPLRAPDAVELRARLRADVRPSDVQALLDEGIETEIRGVPHISLQEVDSDEVVVLITAIPLAKDDGPKLADEVLAAISSVVREADDERAAVGAT
jgi:small conductance mechanosensitive channel